MSTRITVTLDDEAAALVADTNASATVRDALRWAARLDLTEGRVQALVDLSERLSALGVDDPLAYAASIAEDAYRDALDAVQALTAARWTGGEILAAMQAMMGTLWLRGMSVGGQLAAEMSDGARLGGVDLAAWGVTPERWRDLVVGVAAYPEDARALVDVARVFWTAQGSALERVLRRDLQRQDEGEAA